MADSKSTTIEVIQNEINELIKKINLKYICCMYASLLLDDVDIVRSLNYFEKNKKVLFLQYIKKNKKY